MNNTGEKILIEVIEHARHCKEIVSTFSNERSPAGD